MTRFFTADSHFSLSDENVIKRDFRPFSSLTEMNDEILKIWNSQLSSGDVVYHLGDFVNYNWFDNVHFKECLSYVKRINAKVILICGNNEEKIIHHEFNDDFEKFKTMLLEIGFAEVERNGMIVEIGGTPFYLTHEPKNHREGMENLFGHIHGTVFVKPYGFNVGIDNHYLKMFSEDEVLEMISRRKFFDENVYN
jgi:calcineurin-like phosphoesterase family protein